MEPASSSSSSSSSYYKHPNRSKKKTMIPPRRGEIKRKIVGQIVNSAVSVASKATNMLMKNKGGKKEEDGSSPCTSSPLTPSDYGVISDGVSDSGR
ncbi:unnamed protein product [Lactuca virosa]|uniref:Uncharacterized protein n=1 Tax=Lactuca virosa TaxID=75947 RepID=A0AAU9LUT0_9ASTR|nr:unnamed protein product [Lactuca virosa]